MTVLSKLARHPGATRTAARRGAVVVQPTYAAVSGSTGFRCGESAARAGAAPLLGKKNSGAAENQYYFSEQNQVRLFCSALRTATKELAAVLQAPDDVVLLDTMTEQASVGKSDQMSENTSSTDGAAASSEPTTSSPEAGEEVAQQTKMLLDDVEAALAWMQGTRPAGNKNCASEHAPTDDKTAKTNATDGATENTAESSNTTGTTNENKLSQQPPQENFSTTVPHVHERLNLFLAFCKKRSCNSPVSQQEENFVTKIGKLWSAALESTQFHPIPEPFVGPRTTSSYPQNIAVVFDSLDHAMVRMLQGYRVLLLQSTRCTGRATGENDLVDEQAALSEMNPDHFAVLKIAPGNGPQPTAQEAEQMLRPLLKRAACLDNDIFRLREKAVLEGKNYNLLLQAPLDVTDLSLPSVFHGLQRRAFVEWKDKKEDFYRYELADRADELLSLLHPNEQESFHNLLSTFFELLHGFYCDKKGGTGTSGAASSETETSLGCGSSSDNNGKTLSSAGGDQSAVVPQFRKNLHICLQSETSLPDALVKLAVLADACPPEMFLGDADENTPSSPCLNLHVFDKVEKRKDPIRGFLRMLSKRPDIWKIHYYNGNEQSSTSSSGAAREPTANTREQSGDHDKKNFDAVAEKIKIGAMAQTTSDAGAPAAIFLGMQDIHLLPKTFQAVIAGQENAFLYRGFPRDALSLLKLVMGNTKQEGSGEMLAGRGGSSLTLPPCDLIKAIEHRDEFEDFPDDFPDDDDRMMRDMGVSEDDFGEEEELDADEDDEETAEAGDEDQQYKSMQDSTALEAESPPATEKLSSEAESADLKMTPEFGSGMMKTSEPATVLEKRNRSGDHHDVAAQEGTIKSSEDKSSEEEQAAGEAQRTVPAEEILHGSKQPADTARNSTVKQVQKA
ncbi:unnamed protein product [Amoebophrya sp. A120]|nr:unnamed protein product [Amoebophrya sp. A120]|eukprot:GSA120T00008621001.1